MACRSCADRRAYIIALSRRAAGSLRPVLTYKATPIADRIKAFHEEQKRRGSHPGSEG